MIQQHPGGSQYSTDVDLTVHIPEIMSAVCSGGIAIVMSRGTGRGSSGVIRSDTILQRPSQAEVDRLSWRGEVNWFCLLVDGRGLLERCTSTWVS